MKLIRVGPIYPWHHVSECQRFTEEKLLKACAHVFTGTTRDLLDSVWKKCINKGDG